VAPVAVRSRAAEPAASRIRATSGKPAVRAVA
jgi:hypothetical protein